MSGNKKALLDSNIIIYLSKNMVDVADLLEKYEYLYISIITYMEVLGYKFEKSEEKAIITEIVNTFDIINLDHEIANKVIEIREKNKIKLPDAIILATAQSLKADLITNNIQDFPNIDGISIISIKL